MQIFISQCTGMDSIQLHRHSTELRGLDEYLTEVYRYLTNYSWIYDVQMTEFFVKRVWEHIPEDVSGLILWVVEALS